MKQPRLTSSDLTQIREQTDWRNLFETLQIQRDLKKSRDHDWWGKSPFNPTERTASFHMNDRGWYCHSTSQGGGVIELVQQLHPAINCYEAARWLVEHGVSHVNDPVRINVEAMLDSPEPAHVSEGNLPIRQDLRSQLATDHPEFTKRGIPYGVLGELGAGYLDRPPRMSGKPDPINQRLVFQIRGVEQRDDGSFSPIILGHIGRATTLEQVEEYGKWWTFRGFRKSLEVYNIDLLLNNDEARQQVQGSGHVLIVEGCFDVAKLFAAGIRNVVATLGAHLSPGQLEWLDLISQELDVERFLLWYDRDQDGTSPNGQGAVNAAELLTAHGFEAEIFDWQRQFHSTKRGTVTIPSEITDPCEFSVEQLQWLRQRGVL